MSTSDDLLDQLEAGLQPRYRLDSEIGQGGMAIVFRARDTVHDRSVAIKALRPDLSAVVGAERFLREVEIAARLQHPNVLPLFDSGEMDGVLYYVMPLVDGQSVKDVLAEEGPLPIDQAVKIGAEVADALAYAHEKGVVHRDIKPGNVLLTSGHAIVADFGVATALSEAGGDRLTQSGIAIGTPAYMSPEQAGGEPVTGQSDIYSLGCLMYEMLAGEPPFGGRSAQAVMAKQMLEPAPFLRGVRPELPVELEDGIRQLLAKVPADRPNSATSVADALRTGSWPLRVITRRPRTRALRRRLVPGLLLVGVTGIGLWSALRPGPLELSSNDPVVFPIRWEGPRERDGPDGLAIAGLVGTILEHDPSLSWTEGWGVLDGRQREGYDLLSAESLGGVARAAGSRYFIDGTQRATADSVRVTLVLHDATGDTIVARASHTAPASPIAGVRASLSATADLVPLMSDSAAAFAFDAGAHPAEAWTHFAVGLDHFRHSRFERALDELDSALALDSTLAIAAVTAALSGLWAADRERINDMTRLAMMAGDDLPSRYRDLAAAVGDHWRGFSQSALAVLDSLVERHPGWALAQYMRGEVYTHLLPYPGPSDSLAQSAFRSSLRTDPGLSPGLFHLVEMKVREGDIVSSDSLLARYASFDPDSLLHKRLQLMLHCVSERPGDADWTAMLGAAIQLSMTGRQPRCGERALREVIAAIDSIPHHRWGAFFALQGLLVALGRDAEAAAMIDSSVQAGTSGDQLLYVLNTMAGADMGAQAADVQTVAEQYFSESLEAVDPLMLWLFGTWYAHIGDVDQVARYAEEALTRSGESSDPQIALYAQALHGHLARLQGDTAVAIELYRNLSSVTGVEDFEWAYGEAYPVARIELARLLLSTGDYPGAFSAAASFDSPGPVIGIPFLPLSLSLRYQAAVGMERSDLASDARERLMRLGREDIVGGLSQPKGGRS